jgi:RecJ-like exonuclease
MSYYTEISDGLRDRQERESVSFEARLPDLLRESITDGEIKECPVVSRWEICEICNGDGGHARRFGTMVGSLEELSEETWQRYASGALDEPCHECRSTGKVSVLDEDKLSPEARELVKEWRDSFYENQAEQWAERFC